MQAYYALVEALRELEEKGGWTRRHERYKALADQVRLGFGGIGIRIVVPPEESSVMLRAYYVPSQIAYNQMHNALKANGFVIYAGQGPLSTKLFRISTMGNIRSSD